MSKLSEKIAKNNFLALHQYSIVENVTDLGNSVRVKTSDGETLGYQGIVNMPYIQSGDHFNDVIRVGKREMEEIFSHNPNTAMTVVWNKQVKEKEATEKFRSLYANQGGKLLSLDDYMKQVKDNVKDILSGEERTARGWHTGGKADGGRYYFTDIDKENDPNKDYDTRTIQVDPRTIKLIIVNNIKYTLK